MTVLEGAAPQVPNGSLPDYDTIKFSRLWEAFSSYKVVCDSVIWGSTGWERFRTTLPGVLVSPQSELLRDECWSHHKVNCFATSAGLTTKRTVLRRVLTSPSSGLL